MGCAPSKEPTTSSSSSSLRSVTAVGLTERNLARKARKAAAATKTNNNHKNQSSPPQLDQHGKLVPREIALRTQCSKGNQTFRAGTIEYPIDIEYACWSQRGYYPDDPHKPNQDALSVNGGGMGGNDTDALWAVYDGHGPQGHACAEFCRTTLPRCIDKHIRRARNQRNRQKQQSSTQSQSEETTTPTTIKKKKKGFDPNAWPLLNPDDYKACCRKAFLECNQQLFQEKTIESQKSGTTAITASLHGNQLIVCNVGDSRVLLGHRVKRAETEQKSAAPEENTQDTMTTDASKAGKEEEEKEEEKEQPSTPTNTLTTGDTAASTTTDTTTNAHDTNNVTAATKILAIPLSRDQTPYRKDERERVKKCGAAIMSIDQMEGLEEMHENWGDLVLGADVDMHGDPPRVWVQGKNYPGTAFTRSIGDALAEDIGVHAEPEMIVRELTSNDEILILATDGVFEFLTNQQVVDMGMQCGTPLQACECIVKTAYEKWITYDHRTDDITVIVCRLKCSRPPPQHGETGTTEDLVTLAESVYGTKPVRASPRSKRDTLCCTPGC